MYRTKETLNKSKQFSSRRKNRNNDLPQIIYNDLLRYGKLPLFLFLCIIVTAILVIITVYHTRLLITQCEQLTLEKNNLNIKWRNLILEKNLLRDHSRLEQIATEKLKMERVNSSQENIVIQIKNKR